MPDEFPYGVFLSHNAKDKPRVQRLVPVSQLSTLNSQPSAGLEQSRVLLLVPLSQLSTLNSQPPRTAVHRDPANAGRRFIPLLLGDCALPDTLRRYKVVDFREESEAAFAEVLATVCLWFLGENGNATAKLSAFKSAQIPRHSAIVKPPSNFHLI